MSPPPLFGSNDAGASTSVTVEPIVRGMERYVEPKIYDTYREAKPALRKLRQKEKLGLELHGVNVGLKGTITLVVIVSFEEGGNNVHLFDVQACPTIMAALKPLMENPHLTKITHDCRGDRANLFNQYQIHLRGVFDTQIAHKYANGGKDKLRISWLKLLRRHNLQPGPMRELFRDIYKSLPNMWEQRPLTRAMKALVSMDIIHYGTLHGILDPYIAEEDRAAFLRDCDTTTLTSETTSAEF